jgi:ribosomal protein S18 acetylase RimI-like enzyme
MGGAMADVTIRRATLADLEPLSLLFDGYRRFYENPTDLEGARRFLRARLEANESVVFVAEGDGRLAGFTQLYPSFSSGSMNRVWILNDLFVAPERRRGGVGAALMKAAEDFARAGASKGLVLATQKTNATAKALYERCGYRLDALFDHYLRFF